MTTQEFFSGKKIVLFGLPGAFTPTCHKNHLPGFLTEGAAFKAKGVVEIAMTSVNDPFVLMEWSKATGSAGHIAFLSDGNADFAKALGLEFDASMGGLGVRSRRYSMLVEDGVVKLLNIEESPGRRTCRARRICSRRCEGGARGALARRCWSTPRAASYSRRRSQM